MTTPQQVFDKVSKHLITQGEGAHINGSCKYRAHESGKVLMCAAGCLIPESEYTSDMEGLAIGEDFMEFLKPLSPTRGLFESHSGLIADLQSVHDNVTTSTDLRDNWDTSIRTQLKYVAQQFKLSTKILDLTPKPSNVSRT